MNIPYSRQPGMFIDFDASNASQGVKTWKTLIINQTGAQAQENSFKKNWNAGDYEVISYTIPDKNASAQVKTEAVNKIVNKIGDEDYSISVMNFFDDDLINAIESKLIERWSYESQTDGVLFFPVKDDTEAAIAKTYNSQYLVACYTPISNIYCLMGAVSAKAGQSALSDPAMPLQTLELNCGFSLLEKADNSKSKRLKMLNDGISTFKVNGNSVQIERLVTTYKKNKAGENDSSLLPVEKVFTLSYLRKDFRQYFWSKYARSKLKADDANIRPDAGKILTPKLARAEAIKKFLEWEEQGLVQNSKDFIENLSVQIDAKNRDKINFILPPTLIDQLNNVAVSIQFK